MVERVLSYRHPVFGEKPVPQGFWSIDPRGSRAHVWQLAMFLISAYLLISVSYVIAFPSGSSFPFPLWFLVLNVYCDLMLWLDIVLSFLTGVYRHGKVDYDFHVIWKNHLHFNFSIDVAAALPFDWILVAAGIQSPWFRINKMLRIYHANKYSQMLAESPRKTIFILQVLRLISIAFFLMHILACGWVLIGRYLGFGSDSWVAPASFYYSSAVFQYLFSLFWSSALALRMTTLGVPLLTVEILYSLFVLLVGLVGFAYLVGRFSSFVTDAFKDDFEFLEKKARIVSFMRLHSAPKTLIVRALQFLSFRQKQKGTALQQHVFEDVPEALTLDLKMFTCRKIIDNSQLLQNLEPAAIAAIIRRCERRLYMPGQRVFRYGDVCGHVYFVRDGSFQVLSLTQRDERAFVSSSLDPIARSFASHGFAEVEVGTVVSGSEFGIQAITHPFSGWRTSIRSAANTFSKVLAIHVNELQDILKLFPESNGIFDQNVSKIVAARSFETTQISASDSFSSLIDSTEDSSNGETLFEEDVEVVEEKRQYTLLFLSAKRRTWDFAMVFLILYNVFSITFNIGFMDNEDWTVGWIITWGVLNLTSDILLWIDTWFSLYKPFLKEGILIEDPKSIRAHNRPRFILHVTSMLPLDYIVWILFFSGVVEFRVVCWARLPRIFLGFEVPSYALAFLVFRYGSAGLTLMHSSLFFVICIHICAVIYIFFHRSGTPGQSTQFGLPLALISASPFRQYLYSIFFVLNNSLVRVHLSSTEID